MYIQAQWVNTKNNAKISQLVEAESWNDAARQCVNAYEGYTLRFMNLVQFDLDPWDISGNAYTCTYVQPEGAGQRTILVMAKNFQQAQEILKKFSPEKTISIKLTQFTYKTRG